MAVGTRAAGFHGGFFSFVLSDPGATAGVEAFCRRSSIRPVSASIRANLPPQTLEDGGLSGAIICECPFCCC